MFLSSILQEKTGFVKRGVGGGVPIMGVGDRFGTGELYRHSCAFCNVPTLPSFASQMPPPLGKGRTVRGTVRCNPGAATMNHGGPPKAVEGWLRCKKHYCDNRAAIYVSTPQSRLRRASPPWQGGPRGWCNAVNTVQPLASPCQGEVAERSEVGGVYASDHVGSISLRLCCGGTAG